MPEAHAFIVEESDNLTREDRFDPYQLWYHDQCEGRWQDTRGNILILGRITNTLPEFTRDYITRERYTIVSSDRRWQIDSDKTELIHQWAATFIGETIFEPEALNINSFMLSAVYAYTCSTSNKVMYTFHPRRIGNSRNFDWFCAVLESPATIERAELQRHFETAWLAAITQPSTIASDEGIRSNEISTTRQGRPDFDQPHHPVRLAARKSIENYAEWWFAETDGYIILSDINDNLGKSLVESIQHELPILLEAERKLLPPLTSTRDIALIRIFQFKSDYDAYVGERYQWSSGIWMPRRRELALTQEFHKEEILRTLRHEALHQYISYAWGMLTPSPWLNEGHACLFENAQIDTNGNLSFDEDPRRTPVLLENLDLAVELIPYMLNMDYEEFYAGGGSEQGRSLNYALAWSLVYYLQKGAPQERNTPFKKILPDYAAALLAARDFQEATALAFAEVDMKVFQANFKEFWLKRRASAMRYDPLEKIK